MIFIVCLHTWYFAHFLTLWFRSTFSPLCFLLSYFFQSGVSCYSPMSGCSRLPFLQVLCFPRNLPCICFQSCTICFPHCASEVLSALYQHYSSSGSFKAGPGLVYSCSQLPPATRSLLLCTWKVLMYIW